MRKPPAFTHIRSEEERLWDKCDENNKLRKKIRILRSALKKIKDRSSCGIIEDEGCCHCIAQKALDRTKG